MEANQSTAPRGCRECGEAVAHSYECSLNHSPVVGGCSPVLDSERVAAEAVDEQNLTQSTEERRREMATKGNFPKTLNVTIENEGEGDNEYLDPIGTLESKAVAGEERLVAVYELKELVTVKANVTTEIVKTPYEGA